VCVLPNVFTSLDFLDYGVPLARHRRAMAPSILWFSSKVTDDVHVHKRNERNGYHLPLTPKPVQLFSFLAF